MTFLPKIFFQPWILRKLLWLLILTCLISTSIFIIPKVETASPAIESKMLALRVFLAAIFIATVASFRLLLRLRWHFVDLVFSGLVLSFGLSALTSGRIGYSLVEGWHLGAFFCLAWIIYRLQPSFKECATVAWLGGLLGLFAGIYGFLTFVGLDVLRPLYPFAIAKDEGGRNFIHSFYGNPEYFGGFAAPTSVLLLGLGFQPNIKKLPRVILTGAAFFLIGVLALSGSRGALFGFLLGTCVVFLGQIGFLSRQMKRACWLAGGLAFLSVMAGLFILSTPNPLNPRDVRLLQRFSNVANTQSDSVRERLLFYTSTAFAIPHNPVMGYGPASYRLEFLNNVQRLVENDERAGTVVLLKAMNRRLAEHTHNDYLEIWFEQGTIGFALFLLLIVHGAVRFLTTRLRLRQFQRIYQALAAPASLNVTLLAAVLTILINALTSFPLHMPARGTLAWVLIGTFFAADRQLREAIANQAGTTQQSPQIPKDTV